MWLVCSLVSVSVCGGKTCWAKGYISSSSIGMGPSGEVMMMLAGLVVCILWIWWV